jgi:hypothetical protein
MIVFLIPVRHENSVNDYEKTWRLLNHTLTSIANQDSPDWHVVVCANKVLPIFPSLPSHKITFLEYKSDFIGRTMHNWNFHEFRQHLQDKAYRRRCCLLYAQQHLKASWYFMADADDYLSSDLVSTIQSTTEPQHLITTIECGLIVSVAKNQYVVTDDFNEVCGTSLAIFSEMLHQNIDDPHILGTCLSQHKYSKYFTELFGRRHWHRLAGRPYAAYLQHEENHGRKLWDYGAKMADAQPITQEIRAQFSIPETLGLTTGESVLE